MHYLIVILIPMDWHYLKGFEKLILKLIYFLTGFSIEMH
jgi:hypothetical protein